MLLGGVATLEAGGAEEDDCILNLFAAKTRERFLILREDTQNASVGTVDEGLILVGEGADLSLSTMQETHLLKCF